MQPAKPDNEPPEDEDVWDRIADVLEPLAEAVDPDPPPDRGDDTTSEKQRN